MEEKIAKAVLHYGFVYATIAIGGLGLLLIGFGALEPRILSKILSYIIFVPGVAHLF